MVVTCRNKRDKKGGKKRCSYRIWASWMSTKRSLQIKDIVDKPVLRTSIMLPNDPIMTCKEILESVD